MSERRKFNRENARLNSGKPLLELIQHKYGSIYSSQRLPSARPDNAYLNRNISCLYPNKLYNTVSTRQKNLYYDFSESDTAPGTPDIRSEESDSSTGSVLCRADAAAAKILADEWARIERTLYDEEGDKVTRSQLVEECKQWKELVPHLRIIGKRLQLPETRQSYKNSTEEEEIFAIHQDDPQNASSDSEGRLTDSSESDCTPSNSPRHSFQNKTLLQSSPSTQDEFTSEDEDSNLSETFNSFLQIKHINPSSPRSRNTYRQRNVSSILRSEISSSKWRRNDSPDLTVPRRLYSSVVNTRGSAKSFVSSEPSYVSSLSMITTDNSSGLNRVSTASLNRVSTARMNRVSTANLNRYPTAGLNRVSTANPNRDSKASMNRFSTGNLNRVSTATSRVSTAQLGDKLQPIEASQSVIYSSPYVKSYSKSYQVLKNNRKVSLPPIDIEEGKGRMHNQKSVANSRVHNGNKKSKNSLIPLITNRRGTFDINENR